MKTNKQKSDFIYIGTKLLKWYQTNKRQLPWRNNKNPYSIWISEIVLQQTQVKQGLQHYLNFIKRFPDVITLANASEEEVLLYWKGLGYYSRALNLHQAAQQLVSDYNAQLPTHYKALLDIKGIGKYTAAAIASIAFDEKVAAVDGNFYRVLSRLFADNFDISNSKAFTYFSHLAERIMPEDDPGAFNQSIMDLGSEVCKPKNPLCIECPLHVDCNAFALGTVSQFPVKLKKIKVEKRIIDYQFIYYNSSFLIKQRDTTDIWKKLYDFPNTIALEQIPHVATFDVSIDHKLSHRALTINISAIQILESKDYETIKTKNNLTSVTTKEAENKSFPKPLHDFYVKYF